MEGLIDSILGNLGKAAPILEKLIMMLEISSIAPKMISQTG